MVGGAALAKKGASAMYTVGKHGAKACRNTLGIQLRSMLLKVGACERWTEGRDIAQKTGRDQRTESGRTL